LRDFRSPAIFEFFNTIPPPADITDPEHEVRLVPILLQKSFWGVEQKFLEPLMRFARGDVRDHID
jgi:hypothetical protein